MFVRSLFLVALLLVPLVVADSRGSSDPARDQWVLFTNVRSSCVADASDIRALDASSDGSELVAVLSVSDLEDPFLECGFVWVAALGGFTFSVSFRVPSELVFSDEVSMRFLLPLTGSPSGCVEILLADGSASADCLGSVSTSPTGITWRLPLSGAAEFWVGPLGEESAVLPYDLRGWETELSALTLARSDPYGLSSVAGVRDRVDVGGFII